MKEIINLQLTPENINKLEQFSQILHKDMSTMLNEALRLYFENEEKKLTLEEDHANTNLDFDEFWDGVDL